MSNSGELDSIGSSHSPEQTGIKADVRHWFEEQFWPLYPRKEGRQTVLKAVNSKATTPERRAFYLPRLHSELPTYLQRKNASGQGGIPMAATWFNQDRAEDELEPLHTVSREAPRAVKTINPNTFRFLVGKCEVRWPN